MGGRGAGAWCFVWFSPAATRLTEPRLLRAIGVVLLFAGVAAAVQP